MAGRTTLALLLFVSSACGCDEHESAPRDATAPRVVDCAPREGEVGIASEIEAVHITFDEPMDTATEAVLRGGAIDIALTGSWSADTTTVSFAIAAPLAPATVHRLDLRGMRDTSGNRLDPVPYLGDGVLDFTTSPGDAPYVVSSEPAEGALEVDPLLSSIALTFSEPMDANLFQVKLGDELIAGTWSDDARVLTVALLDSLTTGTHVAVDVRALRDRDRNGVNALHPYLGDGILDFVLADPSGENCAEPLLVSQAAHGNGFYTWHIPPATVSATSGVFGCDPSAGPDAVIAYQKTSDDLLHVIGLAQQGLLNLAVTWADCSAGIVEKCVSGRDSWEAFLDVPAGSYWIWVSSTNGSDASFPGAIVSIEEIPATAPQAQGEGCFAPFTTSSANYTPPAASGDPHVWSMPPTISSFDVATATSGSGSMSCANSPLVDAVIELQKAPATNAFVVGGGPLAAVLDGCNAMDPNTNVLACWRGSGTGFTVIPPEGPAYIWAGVGEVVTITELTLATGEAPVYAEPITGSGAVNASSTMALEVPWCLGQVAGIHWYSYVAGDTLVGVRADAPGGVAVIDAQGGLACSFDTTTVAVGRPTQPGDTLFIAVETPTPIGYLEIIEDVYEGVGGSVTDLGVSFPTPAGSAEGMTVGTSEIFVSSNHAIWSFPKTGNAVAVAHDGAQGLTTAQLGKDITVAQGKLFTVDTNGSSPEHLWAVYDEATSLWGPTGWDVSSSWPPTTFARTVTYDGMSLVAVTNGTLRFLSSDPVNAPAPAVLLGSNDAPLIARRVAADAAYFYVAASGAVEGIYRFERANLAAPPLLLFEVSIDGSTATVVDDVSAAHNLYVTAGPVLSVARPAHATPIYLGALGPALWGWAMSIDHATNTLFLLQGPPDSIAAVQ